MGAAYSGGRMSDLIGRTSVGTMQVLELDASVSQGLNVPPGATLALISVEGKVRWRDDAPPSPAKGHWMTDERMLYGGSLAQIRFIAQSGLVNDPIVTVSFYR
jgi:hypothetical protein